jgi:uncharacterized membrane protein YphA (DoxX/SURF4 family)
VDVALLLARVLLVGVFALAGAGKLADPQGTRSALGDLGAPARLIPSLAVLLPAAELATAGLLAYSPTVGLGAWIALGLLLVFSVAVARALAAGRAPDCRCLGQLGGGRVSEGTLARNFALAVAAGLVLVAES